MTNKKKSILSHSKGFYDEDMTGRLYVCFWDGEDPKWFYGIILGRDKKDEDGVWTGRILCSNTALRIAAGFRTYNLSNPYAQQNAGKIIEIEKHSIVVREVP